MNKIITFMITLTLLLGAVQTQAATILADARGDFVAGTNDGDLAIMSATGTGEWRSLGSDTVNPTSDPSLTVLPWNASNGFYINWTTGWICKLGWSHERSSRT